MSWIDNIKKKNGVDFVPYNANDYPTLQELVQHYTGTSQYIQTITNFLNPSLKKASGGFNDTFFHESVDYGPLAFRISKEPIYTYKKRFNLDILIDRYFNIKVPERTDARLLEKHMGEIVAQTEKNWLKANEKEICPRIIYYGYIKYINNIKNFLEGEENKVQLKSCLITEAYDEDLYSFYYRLIYKLPADGVIQLNKYVCEQLVELIDKYVESNIVCSDIKPENVVIKIVNNTINSSEDIQVRLIDLDGDFCKKIESLSLYDTRRHLRNDKDKYKILLCIILANHFFYKLKEQPQSRYVFEEYFTEKYSYIFNKRQQLKTLFKGELETVCEHYFEEREDDDGNIIGYIDPESLRPDESIFDVLFDNVVGKPEYAEPVLEKTKSKSAKPKPAKSQMKTVQKNSVRRGGKLKKSKKSKKLNKTRKSKK